MKQTALALLLLTGSLFATPPLDHDAAVAWADRTVPTTIPKEKRVYVLGPESRAESYLLDGKPATQTVAVRRIVSAEKVRALSDLQLTRFGKMPVTIQVYRQDAPGTPILTTGNVQSVFLLQTGDVVAIRFGP